MMGKLGDCVYCGTPMRSCNHRGEQVHVRRNCCRDCRKDTPYVAHATTEASDN